MPQGDAKGKDSTEVRKDERLKHTKSHAICSQRTTTDKATTGGVLVGDSQAGTTTKTESAVR